jgi:hypothetical protein
MPKPICAECLRLSALYYKLVSEHTSLTERQRLTCEEEKGDVEPLVVSAHYQVERARAEFMEHRQTHAESEKATHG